MLYLPSDELLEINASMQCMNREINNCVPKVTRAFQLNLASFDKVNISV